MIIEAAKVIPGEDYGGMRPLSRIAHKGIDLLNCPVFPGADARGSVIADLKRFNQPTHRRQIPRFGVADKGTEVDHMRLPVGSKSDVLDRIIG